MLPCLAIINPVYTRDGDFIFLGHALGAIFYQESFLSFSRNVTANINNCSIGKLGVGTFFTNWHYALSESVSRIIARCSWPNMRWVYAKRVVSSGAVVASKQTLWHWSINQLVRKTMGRILRSRCHEYSIPFAHRANPYPARFCFLDVVPETLFNTRREDDFKVNRIALATAKLTHAVHDSLESCPKWVSANLA